MRYTSRYGDNNDRHNPTKNVDSSNTEVQNPKLLDLVTYELYLIRLF